MGCNPQFQPYGDIGARWRELGGENGRLGCPTRAEEDYGPNLNPHPRIQFFRNGTIGWHPQQGHHMTTVIWRVDDTRVMFMWGLTDPFHYDEFLVRWRRGSSWQQSTVDRNETWGVFGPIGPDPSFGTTHLTYEFQVEGYNTGIFGGSAPQGWTFVLPYAMW